MNSSRESGTGQPLNLLITGAEVDGRRMDVRLRDRAVRAMGPSLAPTPDETVVEARGGALLPGLHDHHLHLLSLAAAGRSVICGPPTVRTEVELRAALRHEAARSARGSWIRGIGYTESVAGRLDRWTLDRLVADRPVRLQHRGGALWILNSLAVERVADGLESSPDVERTSAGQLTGRLFRYDARLRRLLGDEAMPDLTDVGQQLAELGVTGVTDASPELQSSALTSLTTAVEERRLPQRVQLLGAPDSAVLPRRMTHGPWKLHLHDHDLPGLDELVTMVAAARDVGRAVAVHCVTLESILLTVVALESAGGPIMGDRIEHGAVIPTELHQRLAKHRLVVVTQPSFVADRGDDYLADVDARDQAFLYPYASLLAAGVRVAPSSDAPFGELDPWRTLRTARERRTLSGGRLGEEEQVHPATTLAGFLSPLEAPGGPPRVVRPGAPADVCLMHEPLAATLDDPSSERVRLVVADGELVAGSG